jgi:hypothetical protein
MDGSAMATGLESRTRRRSLRRAVELEVDVVSELWDVAIALPLTDLSLDGAWLESELPLSVGDEIELCFAPPRWFGLPRLQVGARVVRVSLLRRQRDRGRAGMGVCFTDLSLASQRCLEHALRGLPPPLPELTRRPTTSRFDRRGPLLELEDGTSYWLRAEAALLTGGRARPAAVSGRRPGFADTLVGMPAPALVPARSAARRLAPLSTSSRAPLSGSALGCPHRAALMSAIFDLSRARARQPAPRLA